MINDDRLDYLMQIFEKGMLTEQEEKELNAWFNSFIATDLEYPEEEVRVRSRMFVRLMKDSGYVSKTKRIRQQQLWLRIAAIFLLFFTLGVTCFYLLQKPSDIFTNQTVVNGKIDIKPGGNAAQLILEDGSTVNLDAQQGEIKMGERIVYADGRIVKGTMMQHDGLPDKMPKLKLKAPKAGQYRIQLSDGTIVWMNAKSVLTYPQQFIDDRRVVELEGEAYFEVAHDATKPFLVKTDRQTIQVLGTKFNVDNYPDRSIARTTLISGAVKISTGHGNNVLKPGQQAIVTATDATVKDVHAEDAIAWKNGRFLFYNERLDEVMDRISNWYNINIVFQNEQLKAERIFAAVGRYENISVVLSKIEATGVASFIIERNQVLVVPSRTN